ncbi:molybdenum cofactor guanylyltransferase [Desulfacinum hydrothermale DSM 13146]|uniref:Probable molybdenum cofactor guanylyltransferase n=1 Tax=Desulfacinum hydrothermale DSM 13146 TaxID=1121390 RepID=A0A1W1XMS7_9BACT|nr:molybdenum cofactor guanylyltransferase [Desulfacinum hydrothermale]SMC24831.1 molybdenum cofactor guanylyltransferase [Desulfacinum hydrothermale DSM 13146]
MITGAVLAGGQSRRFGRDKALEIFQGNRLVDRAVQGLCALCDPVLVVANDLGPLLDVDAALVRDVLPRRGPLGGIYTALYFSPHPWVLVKATDMPFLEPALGEQLVREAARTRADVIVARMGPYYEPLLAAYHVRCLPHVARCLREDRRQIISFYGKVRLRVLEEEQWRPLDPEGKSFWNVNTPEDLRRILAHEDGREL